MITVHCVLRATRSHRSLAKDIELFVRPMTGEAISIHEDWALFTVDYVYIERDSMEVGVSSNFSDEDIAELEQNGWRPSASDMPHSVPASTDEER